MMGSSVDVSGFITWDIWPSMYTLVSEMSFSGLDLGCRRVCSVDVVLLTKDSGFSNGEGAELFSGQARVKPAGSFEG